MIRTDRFGLLSALAAAVLFACTGAVTGFEGLGVFRTGGITAASRFSALAADEYRPAASTLSKTLLLETCAEAITSFHGRLQRADTRRAVLENCLKQADAITNARMLRSQVTDPVEQWIAPQRAALVEDRFAEPSSDVRARHIADLRLLVASPSGIASISCRCVREPAFRERIAAIVETTPEADQARFLAEVQSGAVAP